MLRDILEIEVSSIDRPTASYVPPALTVQRAVRAHLTAWPETSSDALIYGLSRGLQTVLSEGYSENEAIARIDRMAEELKHAIKADNGAPTISEVQ